MSSSLISSGSSTSCTSSMFGAAWVLLLPPLLRVPAACEQLRWQRADRKRKGSCAKQVFGKAWLL